jgi:hypothetical protein
MPWLDPPQLNICTSIRVLLSGTHVPPGDPDSPSLDRDLSSEFRAIINCFSIEIKREMQILEIPGPKSIPECRSRTE